MLLPSKMISLPPITPSFSTSQSVRDLVGKVSLPSQTLSGRLVAKGNFGFQTFQDPNSPGKTIEKRTIFIDLDSSEFSAPSNMLNQNDMRGYYVESIRTRMWVQDPTAYVAPNFAHPDWHIEQEAPNTTNQTGSITSSISFSFDASGGVMAADPMATVGAGINISTSHSHALTDFTYIQHSTGTLVDQLVHLTMTKDGTPYVNAGDLVNSWQSPFVGIRLREIPDMASSNVPILAQAVWMNQSPAGLQRHLLVAISINATYAFISGENDGILNAIPQSVTERFMNTIAIDFDDLTQ